MMYDNGVQERFEEELARLREASVKEMLRLRAEVRRRWSSSLIGYSFAAFAMRRQFTPSTLT